MTKDAIVCDTTVLLYLGRIGQIDLLPALFSAVHVPEAVLLELDMGRLLRADTVDPRDLTWANCVSVPAALIDDLPLNRLGAGERAVIAYARNHKAHVAGLDDYRARQLAEELGLRVIGILGTLLRAKQSGMILAVRPLVDEAIANGFRLNFDLYQEVLELAGED